MMMVSWAALLLFRVLNGLSLRTYYDPDEYWQWYEPAYWLLTGHGYLTWEWRPEASIRSWLHPSLLWLLWVLNPRRGDSKWLRWAPRIFTAIVSSALDYGTLRMNPDAAVFILTSWFNWCYVNRGLVNQLESLLVLLFWHRHHHHRKVSLLLISLSVWLRPTTLIFLAGPIMLDLVSGPVHRSINSVLSLSLAALLGIGCQVGMDYAITGRWYVAAWNFVTWNVVKGVASHYGVSNPLYYVLIALPVMFTMVLPFVILQATHQPVAWRVFVATPFVIYSLLPHKEIRFLMPLHAVLWSSLNVKKLNRRVKWLFVLVNVVLGLYFGFVHQSAPLQVSDHISRLPGGSRVLILAPCHSLPHQGYIHRPDVHISFVTCEPHEADAYQDYPHKLLPLINADKFDHVVCYEDLCGHVLSHSPHAHVLQASFFNGFLNGDWRQRGHLQVLGLRSP
jgi:phosphatidylinositol glycan class B